MILDWFNARDAAALGGSLADSISLHEAGNSGRDTPLRKGELQRLLQRAVQQARPLQLNLFKRAKLVGSFKWRLLEKGVDQARVDELTHLLLLQLTGGSEPTVASPAVAKASSGASRKRIDSSLGAADAAAAKGDYSEAIMHLQEVLSGDPNHAPALSRLGDALCFLERYGEAEQAYRGAVQCDPRRADAHLKLGSILHWRGDFLGAETALRRAVKLEPRSANALCSLGQTLNALARVADAKICFEKALRLKPQSTAAFCGLGWIASMEGRFGDAESLLRKALDADPVCSEAQALLVYQRRMTVADQEWLEGAQRMIAQRAVPIETATLRFAMGKYFDDVGNYSRAFEEFRQANERRKHVSAPYDRAGRTAWVDDVIRLYTAECLAKPAEGANDSRQPVFVVGMARSGTSLVEQIIASHPEAIGAGELQFWGMTEHKHQDLFRSRLPDSRFTAKLGTSYLRVLAQYSAEAARVVDKTPANLDYVGFIHRVFPNARFICMQRDPVDTCLSCYFQNFFNAASFTMDLGDLAHYYREHHRLVKHWRAVLPKEIFLEVPYAELVADQEGWSRSIIEFVGLPWDPKVLEFHKTERAVLTASSWQVRQKMYSSSVGRSKNYEKFIGPLLKLHDLSS
jgi:tetratricopeptide (TPR) repeat protein